MTTADPIAPTTQAAPVADATSPPVVSPATEAASGAGEAAGLTPVDGAPSPAPEPTAFERAQEAAKRVSAKAAKHRQQAAESAAAIQRAQNAERMAYAERQARLQAEAEARRWNDAPIEELRRRGIPDKEIAQVAIDENTPEARARRAEERAALVEQRMAQWEQQQRVNASQAQVAAARHAFVKDAATVSEKFPHAAAHAKARPEAFVREAEAVLAERGRAFYSQHGRSPTNAEIYEFLDWQYAKAAELIGPSKGAKSDNGKKPAEGAPVGAGAKTLTSKAGEKASIGTHWTELDPDAQLAHMAAELRQRAAR